MSWPTGGGPYVSDAVLGAPAGLARKFALKKAHRMTSSYYRYVLWDHKQPWKHGKFTCMEQNKLQDFKKKCLLWLPGGQLLLSHLYSIQQLPVVSKVTINHPVPSWSVGMESLGHLCCVDTGLCSSQESPHHCRPLPAECLQMYLATQSLLQRSQLAVNKHLGHCKKAAFLTAAEPQPNSWTNS